MPPEVKQTEPKPMPQARTSVPALLEDNIVSRREPEEEYFKLAVLAVKMKHTESGDAQYIFGKAVDAHTLFSEVKKSGVPFHRWHSWLEEKFDKLKKLENPEPVKEPEPPVEPVIKQDV